MSQALSSINRFFFGTTPDEKQPHQARSSESAVEPIQTRSRLQKAIQKIHDLQNSHTQITVGSVVIANIDLSRSLTLADLQATEDTPLRGKIIESLQLQKSIEEMNKLFPFFERLKKVSYEALDKVSLFSLQTIQIDEDPTKSVVVDALIEEDALVQMPVESLENRRDLTVFAFRVSQIHRNRPDLAARLAQTPFVRPENVQPLQLAAAKLGLLPVEDILAIRDKLPAKAFGLLTDDQVKGLDFSDLSADQIISCILGESGEKETVQRRFSILSQPQCTVLFRKVPGDILRDFPTASFDKLPVTEISEEQIQNLFCSFFIPKNERRARVGMLSADAISAILPKVDSDFLVNLSDDQIRGLDYSKVNQQHLEAIFCAWQLDDQEKNRRIALIAPQAIPVLVGIAERDFLTRLTIEQILALNFDTLEQEQVENIFFGWYFDDARKKAKIAVLPTQTISKILQRGFFEVLKYISDVQLAQIDLKDVPSEFIGFLFPTLDPAKLYPGHEYSTKTDFHGQRRHCWEQRTSTGCSYRSLDDAELRKLMQQRQAICRKNFEILSSQQFQAIREKISPEVLTFLS